MRGWAAGLGLLAVVPSWAAAQSSRPAIGLGAVAVGSDPSYVGAGPELLFRPTSQAQLRMVGFLGRRADRTVARGEVLVQFHFDPVLRRSPGWYAAAGLAGVTGPGSAGYLVAAIGLELRGGAKGRWWIEGGVGGGARLGLGYRWHRS